MPSRRAYPLTWAIWGGRPHNRLVASLWARNPWLDSYLELDPAGLRLRRRDRDAPGARSLQAQYRHWVEQFPGDQVWMQVGAFVERLQWPPRRLGKAGARGTNGLRRMGSTRRGALEGFPLRQLQRRRAALLAAGGQVLFVGQCAGDGTGLRRRLPATRWVRRAPGGAKPQPRV